MVWLERSKSQLFKTFLQIENQSNIKKVMSKTVKASFDPFDMSNMSNN